MKGLHDYNPNLNKFLSDVHIINEYLMERDNVDIIYLDFNKEYTVSHYRCVEKRKISFLFGALFNSTPNFTQSG